MRRKAHRDTNQSTKPGKQAQETVGELVFSLTKRIQSKNWKMRFQWGSCDVQGNIIHTNGLDNLSEMVRTDEI